MAEDVISALNANQIKAKANMYLCVSLPGGNWIPSDSDIYSADAQKMLLENRLECSACAIGAVFVCAVERMDQLTVEEFKSCRGSGDMRSYLGDFFSVEQLDLLEAAFERTGEYVKSARYTGGYAYDGEAEAELDAAKSFGNEFFAIDYDDDGDEHTNFDADACMRAIMENIIEHGGEFKP